MQQRPHQVVDLFRDAVCVEGLADPPALRLDARSRRGATRPRRCCAPGGTPTRVLEHCASLLGAHHDLTLVRPPTRACRYV